MSFFELLVIAVVGLLVVGPEKLPDTIRTGLLWFGRFKRMLNDTKQEFEQQLGVDEIRRDLHNEKIMQSLQALENVEKDISAPVEAADQALKDQIKQIEDSIDDPVPHDPPSPENEVDTSASTEQQKTSNEPSK